MKFLLLITIIALVSCTAKKDASNSPLFVLNQIKETVEKGDTKAIPSFFCEKDAKKMNTANTIGELLLGQRGKALVDLLKKKLVDSHQLNFTAVEFKNEKIEGNTATVDAINHNKEKTKIFHFVKENETWKLCRE